MSNIKKWNYINNDFKACAVKIGNLTLYFSYDMVIAFKHNKTLYICKNEFTNDNGNISRTTGRHLKSVRMLNLSSPYDKIEKIEKSHKELMNLLSLINFPRI